MNNSELELEQWSNLNLPPNKLVDDAIVLKCKPEEEGRLMIKRITIKAECLESSTNGKENSSPDTGYESDSVCRGKEPEFFTPLFTILESPNNCSTNEISHVEAQVKSLPKTATLKDMFNANEESEVLDLTTTSKAQPEQSGQSGVSLWDFPLPTAEEMKSTKHIINEETKLTGVNILESVLESRPPIDTILSCSDGKLGAHRIVLTAASQFMYGLFIGQRSEEIAVVILPDITTKTMVSLLQFAYTGRIVYTEDIQDDIFSAMECLLFGDIQKMSLLPVVISPPPVVKPTEISADSKPMRNSEKPLNLATNHFESNTTLENSKPESLACSSKDIKAKNNNSPTLPCDYCPRTFTKKGSLQAHTTKCHFKLCLASIGEIQMLSFCDICDRQYKTVSRAMACYNKHGLTRCLICLGVFPTTEIKEHYKSLHAKAEGDDLIIKCRWCSRSVSIKNNCSGIASHSSVHWPCANSSKSQKESVKPAKIRAKNTSVSSENNYRPKKTPASSLQTEKAKKNFFHKETSKRRYQSSSEYESDDNFYEPAKHLQRRLQTAKRTGAPVGQSGGLNKANKEIWQDNSSRSGGNIHRSSPKVIMDLNDLPQVVVKLDPIRDIKTYLKRHKKKAVVNNHGLDDKNDSVEIIDNSFNEDEVINSSNGVKVEIDSSKNSCFSNGNIKNASVSTNGKGAHSETHQLMSALPSHGSMNTNSTLKTLKYPASCFPPRMRTIALANNGSHSLEYENTASSLDKPPSEFVNPFSGETPTHIPLIPPVPITLNPSKNYKVEDKTGLSSERLL